MLMTSQLKTPEIGTSNNCQTRFTVNTRDMEPVLKFGWTVEAKLVPPAQWPTITNMLVCVETNDGFLPIIMRVKKNDLLQTARLSLHSEPDRFGRTVDIGIPLPLIDKIWQVTRIIDGAIE